jgi:cell division septation protein DedD
LAHTDDGFHEIQLNGKQLVFLFMAATVVSVVIFLCGVLVGRGVRAEQASAAEAADLAAAAEPAKPAATSGAPSQGASDPTAAAPPPAVDELSYFDRLQADKPAAERLKPAETARVEKPVLQPAAPVRSENAAATTSTRPPAAAAASSSTAASPATAAASEPQGSGFAVQIAALNVRSEADAIAKRLASKGYAAYVMAPPSGSPQIYRVRIGKFDSRGEAETVATKLEKEEQFKPWITR